MSVETHAREHWGTRIGLILAMAGNAVGLGNFLRFPVQAAQNGGGAFMIPYFVSFLLLGIPLMWMEWGIGRYGGRFGHGTMPGMFDAMWKNRLAKYLGVLGLALPFAVLVYYTYIESWSLGYAVLSAAGQFEGLVDVVAGATPEEMRSAFAGFLSEYQGVEGGRFQFTPTFFYAMLFFLATLGINLFVLSRGISGGIEKLARIGMPILLIFAAVLAGYVMFLGEGPGGSSLQGLNYVWNPDWRALWDGAYTQEIYGKDPVEIWLAAAGQVFFTLSLGIGTLHTYASYLSAEDDITLTGLATASTNEFAEIVLGGTIAIPAAVAFFGVAQAQEIAASGAFDLAFATLPAIFAQLPWSELMGVLWFGLLFFAGITSSVALASPMLAFLQDEFEWPRSRAVKVLAAVVILLVLPNIFFLGEGWLNEWDFWAGTFGLVLVATLEVIIFVWIFGTEHRTGFWNRFFAAPDTMWEEVHSGADLRIPRMFKFVLKWITTPFLVTIMVVWLFQSALPTLTFEGLREMVAQGGLVQQEAERIMAVRWAARVTLAAMFIGFGVMVHRAWHREERSAAQPTTEEV